VEFGVTHKPYFLDHFKSPGLIQFNTHTHMHTHTCTHTHTHTTFALELGNWGSFFYFLSETKQKF